MIRGLGFDIATTGDLEHLDGIWDDPFFRRTFTVEERAQALASPRPLDRFTMSFAAKEACFKALGVGPDDVRLSEIAIIDDPSGRPSVHLEGRAAGIVPPDAVWQVATDCCGGRVAALAVLEVRDNQR